MACGTGAMREQVVRWHQADADLIESWEFQFQRVGSTQWEWVAGVSPAEPCVDCFQATVVVPDDALFLRSRSIAVGVESEWSNQTSVVLPEPTFTVGLFVCVLLLAWIKKRDPGLLGRAYTSDTFKTPLKRAPSRRCRWLLQAVLLPNSSPLICSNDQ